MNGVVDADDLAAWQADYGLVAPLASASTAAVPEPTAALSACAAAMSLLRFRKGMDSWG